ncbi:MAG: hypothetical protein WC852_06075 [Candidatus Nanoarchaeia archaeon]|jgi:hypothetical protein
MNIKEKLRKAGDLAKLCGFGIVGTTGPVPPYLAEVTGVTCIAAGLQADSPRAYLTGIAVYVGGRIWNNFRQRLKAETRDIERDIQLLKIVDMKYQSKPQE